MKNIEFTSAAAQKIYTNYINRVKKYTSILSDKDKNEVLMEINSHIYEGMQRFSDKDETNDLLSVLSNLGEPEEYLEPIVADKKIDQAVRTFNPINVFQALVLNFKNGIIFSVFGFLYLFLFTFIFLIFAKILYPAQTGMFYLDGAFQAFGFVDDASGLEDVVGFGFIPVVMVFAAIFYLSITLLLRFTKKKK